MSRWGSLSITCAITSVLAGVLLAGCTSSDPLSETQRSFLSARGAPTIFTIAFADSEVDASGLVVATPRRRIDVWMYGGSPAPRVVFDNGFYVRTEMGSGGLSASALDVSPGDFWHGMSRAEVESQLGPPDRVETDRLGTSSLEVLRYDFPEVIAVSFVDGYFTSVVAGLQVDP